MTVIRPAEPRDLPALRAMLEQRDGLRHEPAAVERHLAGLDPARIRMLVAEVDGDVVGQSSIRLRTLVHGRRSIPAAYWTDLYVDERHRNRMLYVPLARGTLDAARDAGAELTYTANRRPEVYRAHLRLGFRIAGLAPTRMRPMSPVGFAARTAFGPALAGITRPLDSFVMAGVEKLERRVVPTLGALSVSVARVTESGLAEAQALFGRARRRYLAQALELPDLARRFETPLDGRDYHLVSARSGDTQVGAAIVRTARRGRFEATVVLDLAHDGRPEHAHAVVAGIERWARERGSDLVLVLDASPDLEGLWESLGYRTTPEHYLLLVAPAERMLDPLLGNAAGWRFAFADHDAF